MHTNGWHKISKGFETLKYQNMKRLNKKTKVGILITPLLILCVVVCMLALYSYNYPKETIVISKCHYEGYSFSTDNGVQGVVFPRYKLTLINAFNVITIDVTKDVWEGVNKWDNYTTKYEVVMYY